MNPFERILLEKKWTPVELATLLDVDTHRVYEFRLGKPKKVSPSVLSQIKKLGESPDQFGEEYKAFRKMIADKARKSAMLEGGDTQ